jgi:hypothetical protein
MHKKTLCSLFMASMLKCAECSDNGMCEYHSRWIKKLIETKNCKPYKLDSCEAC